MGNPVLWFEVLGKDGKKLRKFYSQLFDWEIQESGGEMDYGLVNAASGGIGGGIGSSPDGSAGFATFYIEVDDPAAYLAKAEKLGGTTLVPPSVVPGLGLTYAYLADPEGHVIGLSNGMAQSQ
jgi:predicted enzyme related to lactoylglutathione lyase